MARRKESETSRISRPALAPGELRIVQAFVNTEDLKGGTDALATPRQLSDWLVKWTLLPGNVEITSADLERARAIRSGIRALVSAHRGAKLDERIVERLNQAIRGARPQTYFHGDGSAHFESEDLDGALGHLVVLVVGTRTGGLWDRLKVCANRDCRALFYDYSNRRTTKWCTKSCNDLMKARTYRRREKIRSPRPGGGEIMARIFASVQAKKEQKR